MRHRKRWRRSVITSPIPDTVGFKQSQVQFADVYASSLTGAGTSQIGIGTKIAQVEQQFTQGNVSASANPLDIAINGGGFSA